MFAGYQNAEEFTRDLMDIGCSKEMIKSLLSYLSDGDKGEVLSELAQRRSELLDHIHKEQNGIAFLDGLLSAAGEP